MSVVIKRRRFFLRGLKLAGIVAAGGSVYSASRFLSANEKSYKLLSRRRSRSSPPLKSGAGSGAGGADETSMEISAQSIPPGGSRTVAVGATPVIVVRLDDGFRAFNAACTHLGCLVKWEEESKRFVCPCHTGTYDEEGRVVAGPPPRGLTRYQPELSGDMLIVSVA